MAARPARAVHTERMRRSYAEFEAALAEQTVEDRQRAEQLRRDAAARSRARRRERTRKAGTARFLLLITSIIATAVIVTIVMFQVLAAVMS
jgi:membrane glycosyltransferase